MKSQRFDTLDGLRGVAAFVVLVFHIVQQHDLHGLPFAGLAVDFFYVLSGFVVAFAYESKLQQGVMSFGDFAWVRVRRLYPLVLLSTLIGIALALLAATVKRDVTFVEVASAGVLGLLLLPSYVFPRWPTAYPFNMASWSLTFEAFVNVVYAAIAKHLTTARLFWLCGLSAGLMIWVALANHGISGGNNQAGFAYGFPRVMFPFFVGVLLYRLRPVPVRRPAACIALMLVLAAALMMTWSYGAALSLLYVGVLFPGVVWIGSSIEVEGTLRKVCYVLGMLSYPVYIMQGPILRVGDEILKRRPDLAPHAWLYGLVEALTVVVLSWAAHKLFDEPAQRFLRRWRSPSVQPAIAASQAQK